VRKKDKLLTWDSKVSSNGSWEADPET